MDKYFDQKKAADKWYDLWEKEGYFKPEINPDGKPFTIILPPPNASGKMHTGNVLMIAIEDLLIRWKRMQGYAALWVPGTDHAGTETQITFEKQLKKEGKSRFNYSRQELYDEIWNFVQSNKHNIETQIRQMGASVDWDRYKFTLDPDVIKTVHSTFKKMVKDDLVYRGDYLVNYCTKCGTTYADVELKHEERTDPLYYLKYGQFILATVRPETKFGDTAVAVHPSDKRYTDWIGKEIEVEGLNGKFNLKVIADDFVDPEFGTGVVKVTPAHDKNDYEAGLRHNLEIKPVIDLNGKLNENAGKYAGLSVFEGRKKVVADLQEKGLMDHIDDKYLHNIVLCKAGHEIEPLVLPNWFIKTDAPHKSFKQPALDAVKTGKIKIYPAWREITYIRWMEEMRDWPISRQNVWGIQIPIWYEVTENSSLRVLFKYDDIIIGGEIQQLIAKPEDPSYRTFIGDPEKVKELGLETKLFTLQEIEEGLQRIIADTKNPWTFEEDRDPKKKYLPETDTFDTWFSSGQWPLVTLGYPDSNDFKKFYPTAVMETGWEIIRLWVSRMVMFGIYNTGDIPFSSVYLHGIVKALDGRKMSKSLGNVINPDEYIDEYGVDALRMGLISGTANGKDFSFPKDKVIAFKHFSNKIWNMAKFMLMMAENDTIEFISEEDLDQSKLNKEDTEYLHKTKELIKNVDLHLNKYRFADAGEEIYQFMWHELADKYIESIKLRSEDDKRQGLSNLMNIYKTCLKLLHPFMPFITEEIYSYLPHQEKSIMIAKYPEV